MIGTLVLRLAAPLQAWGSRSRFVRRETEQAPTKSGVIGMLAAAKGLRRTDDLTELLELRFGVRVDQPGRLVRDLQTARSLDGKRVMPLSYRYYLSDGVFVAAVTGERGLLEGLDESLRRPHFPLYLGRRSCPPAGPVSLGVQDGTLMDVLRTVPWQATKRHQSTVRGETVDLPVLRDAEPGEPQEETLRDEPISFDPRRREYGWRAVVHDKVSMTHPDPPKPSDRRTPYHDAYLALGG
jgi:CRISPR system Cascade subunit CasD